MQENTTRQIRYHLIFWLIYFFLWGARDLIYHPNLIGNMVLILVFSLPMIPFIYFNLFFMVPKLLLKKKWGLYALYLGVGLIVTFWGRYYTCQFVFRDILGAMEPAELFSSWNGYVIVASENVILLLITMALYLIQEWYVKERYTRELEQKNMERELNMLKAQLQPHFLFNNLNTIYFLMETNPTLAKEVMIRFSDVLSHQLYNAKKDKVPLKEELESLENFLKIEALRHEDFLDLKYSFPGNTGNLQIAPMILLTFIENAFKHGQREKGYSIRIVIELQGTTLNLRVVNTNGEKKEGKNGGVGLENVQRRLLLIYPNRHSFQLERTEDTFTVNLTITLDENGQA